ncbi:glutamate dehydrogenase, partial [bacterium]|nr:glutamate dehydrogenase [bacterium]
QYRGKLEKLCEQYGDLEFTPDATPWNIPCDVALPAATQNELYTEDAEALIKNGVIAVAEAADMPCTSDATRTFQEAGVLVAPGKAVNAGGVIMAGLETAQNASHQIWDRAEAEKRLRHAVAAIHEACVEYGREDDGTINYVKGANIAGFVRVAEAMVDQGVV